MTNSSNIDEVLFFSGNGNHLLGEKVLSKLSEFYGIKLSFQHISYAEFPDGESDNSIPNHAKIFQKTVVVIQSTFTQNFTAELLELCWAIKHQYGAKHLIAVLPFMRYRRQDHPEKPEEINRNRMFIERLRHCGVDELVVVTPHSDEIATNCKHAGITFHEVDVSPIFASVINTLLTPELQEKTYVFTPDQGSIPRAINLAKHLDVGVLFSLKFRGSNNETLIVEPTPEQIESVIQSYNFPKLSYASKTEIDGSIIIMAEDEIASGGTSNSTAKKLKACGAKKIYLTATHPVCIPGWKRKLFDGAPFDKVMVCDTIPRGLKERTGGQIHDVSVADSLASVIFKTLRSLIV